MMATDLEYAAAARESTDDAQRELWAGVRKLAERAPRPEGLLRHGLHLFAPRDYGGSQDPAFAESVRHATVSAVMAPIVLQRVREAVDGTVILMKGAEIATRYPDPVMRPFNDIDLLVEDPAGAERGLLAAGFRQLGEPDLYVDHHHLRPLQLPGFPLPIELHHRPSMVSWGRAPAPRELFDDSVPSATGVDGIRAPRPEHHALLLAAHGWAHWPLGRALDLVDVLAASERLDEHSLQVLAASWNMGKVWSTTIAAAECVLLGKGARRPWPLRTWARHIPECRPQTAYERRLTHYLPPFAALAPRPAAARAWSRIHRGLTGGATRS